MAQRWREPGDPGQAEAIRASLLSSVGKGRVCQSARALVVRLDPSGWLDWGAPVGKGSPTRAFFPAPKVPNPENTVSGQWGVFTRATFGDLASKNPQTTNLE